MKSKRKQPITLQKRESLKDTQKIISKFHTLTKNLKKQLSSAEKLKIEKEIEEMGGLKTYQLASLKGGSKEKGFGGAGRWLVKQLQNSYFNNTNTPSTAEKGANAPNTRTAEKGANAPRIVGANTPSTSDNDADTPNTVKKVTEKPKGKLNLLDVDAISGEVYTNYKFLNTTSIDLNSQSPTVIQQDFFNLKPSVKYDVLCLSLVVNFVTEADKRGLMLSLVRKHLSKRGLFYLVLPLSCVKNSRYFTHELMVEMMNEMGYSYSNLDLIWKNIISQRNSAITCLKK